MLHSIQYDFSCFGCQIQFLFFQPSDLLIGDLIFVSLSRVSWFLSYQGPNKIFSCCLAAVFLSIFFSALSLFSFGRIGLRVDGNPCFHSFLGLFCLFKTLSVGMPSCWTFATLSQLLCSPITTLFISPASFFMALLEQKRLQLIQILLVSWLQCPESKNSMRSVMGFHCLSGITESTFAFSGCVLFCPNI